MSVDLGDVCVSTYVRLLFRAPALRVFTLAAQVHKLRQNSSTPTTRPIRPYPTPPHNRSVRMHHSRLCPSTAPPGEDRGPPTWRCT
jgi:hypothetical protein